MIKISAVLTYFRPYLLHALGNGIQQRYGLGITDDLVGAITGHPPTLAVPQHNVPFCIQRVDHDRHVLHEQTQSFLTLAQRLDRSLLLKLGPHLLSGVYDKSFQSHNLATVNDRVGGKDMIAYRTVFAKSPRVGGWDQRSSE